MLPSGIDVCRNEINFQREEAKESICIGGLA
jgi:hypothetical protein